MALQAGTAERPIAAAHRQIEKSAAAHPECPKCARRMTVKQVIAGAVRVEHR